MKVLQGGDDLRGVELCRAGYELAGLSEVTEELPATDVGEQHVETVRVLVAPHQRDNEGMPHLSGGKILSENGIILQSESHLNISFSLMTCSTCFSFITWAIVRILSA